MHEEIAELCSDLKQTEDVPILVARRGILQVNKIVQMLLYLIFMKLHLIELMLTLSKALVSLAIVHQNQLCLHRRK